MGVIEKSPIESVVAPELRRRFVSGDFLEGLGCVVEPIGWPVDGVEVMKNYYVMNSVETAAMFQGMEASFGRKFTKDDMELMTWGIYQSGGTHFSQRLQRGFVEMGHVCACDGKGA